MLPFATRTDAEHYQQLRRQIDRSARELESQGLLPRMQPANGSSGASYSSPFFAVMYLILGSRRCRTTRWNVANRRSSAAVSALSQVHILLPKSSKRRSFLCSSCHQQYPSRANSQSWWRQLLGARERQEICIQRYSSSVWEGLQAYRPHACSICWIECLPWSHCFEQSSHWRNVSDLHL